MNERTAVETRSTGRERLLTGRVGPALAALALPTIAVLFAQTLVGVAETYYVGFLGTDALVGVAVVFPVWMLMTMTSAGGFGSGVASAVARAIGAGRQQDADGLVLHALVLAALLGLGFTATVLAFGRPLYAALGAQGAALDAAVTYSGWLFLGAIPIWIVNLCSAALRGAGNVRVPAMVTLGGAATLIPLSPLLIFGLGPLPRLGVAGAGIAVTAYYTSAAIVLLRFVAGPRSPVSLVRVRLAGRLFADILGVGAISALGGLQLNLAVVLMTGMFGRFGASALAGFGIGSRLDYLLIPILFGLGSAVLAMVGACVGAGDIARARRVAFVGTLWGAAFAELVGLSVAIFPPGWIALFSRDPEVLADGGIYLRAVGPVYFATAIAFVLNFASQGAGRPLWPFLGGTARLLVSALIGWFAVTCLGAGLQALSLLVATGSLAAAIICLLAARTGAILPASATRKRI